MAKRRVEIKVKKTVEFEALVAMDVEEYGLEKVADDEWKLFDEVDEIILNKFNNGTLDISWTMEDETVEVDETNVVDEDDYDDCYEEI